MNLNIFKKRTSPKEALRTSKREMAVATRGIEREIASLQMEEKNLVAEIKKTAKTGNEKNYMMQYLVSKVSRRAFSPVGALYRNASFSSMVAKHYTQKISVPSNFLKWGSLGFCRTLSFATGFTPLQPKPLETIIDVARAKNKSPEELADIWDDFHLGRGHIGLSMKTKLYHLLEQRATDCRYFVIPLWKGSGYTTMFVQVQLPHMLFTGLEDYKARGTQAAPYLTASYYKEFADTKDLVLIRGDVVFTSKLSDDEAKWLLETAQSFYLNDVRYKLVECFNKETREFEFKDVLTALEMPIL